MHNFLALLVLCVTAIILTEQVTEARGPTVEDLVKQCPGSAFTFSYYEQPSPGYAFHCKGGK